MMLQPGILALLLGSGLGAVLLAAAVVPAVRIIRRWDLASGSEEQLRLERQTYLVAAIMRLVMGFQIVFLFLFLQTVDGLAPMFIGAMCAAGSLKVNGFGYPALVAKILTCLLAGLWLILDATDNRASDYPLIRTKYRLLLVITPVLLAETALQALYLLGLEPNIITSCCAIVFSASGGTVVATVLDVPLQLSRAAFVLSATLTLAAGWAVYRHGRGAILFATASACHFLLSIHALIAFISLYVYELPTHHCPFCLLHREYGGIGYPLPAAAHPGRHRPGHRPAPPLPRRAQPADRHPGDAAATRPDGAGGQRGLSPPRYRQHGLVQPAPVGSRSGGACPGPGRCISCQARPWHPALTDPCGGPPPPVFPAVVRLHQPRWTKYRLPRDAISP